MSLIYCLCMSMICCSWSGWYFTFAWQEVWNWWVMNKHFFSLAGGNKIWPQVNPNFLLLNTGKCWTVAVWSECVHPVFCWIVNQTKCKMWPNCEKEKVALAQLTFIACAGRRGCVLVSVAAICAARCQSPWLSVLYRNKVISAQIRQKPATITTQH